MITINRDKNVQTFSAVGAKFCNYALTDELPGRSGTIQVNVTEIPKSFWKGISDCDSGRVIDMDRALNEPPPNVD